MTPAHAAKHQTGRDERRERTIPQHNRRWRDDRGEEERTDEHGGHGGDRGEEQLHSLTGEKKTRIRRRRGKTQRCVGWGAIDSEERVREGEREREDLLTL